MEVEDGQTKPKRIAINATTLDQALDSAGLDRLDWLKLDTQGTDLRLVESLSEPVFATLNYQAQLIRAGEETLPNRETCGTFHVVI